MRMARENTKRKMGRTSVSAAGSGNLQMIGQKHTKRGERAPQLPCHLTRLNAEAFIRKAETIRDKYSTKLARGRRGVKSERIKKRSGTYGKSSLDAPLYSKVPF